MNTIEVVFVGGMVEGSMEAASEAIEKIGFKADFMGYMPVPRSIILPNGQVDGEAFLRNMPGPERGIRRVYLLNNDATVKGLNFVFGVASKTLGVCFVALPRLMLPPEDLFQERLRKEILHELGHTFGLTHCPNPYCVMRFSNSLMEVDAKSEAFCRTCLEKLKNAQKL